MTLASSEARATFRSRPRNGSATASRSGRPACGPARPRSKPRRSRIGRDIDPPCVISAGVPSATASSQRARMQRPIGAAAAGVARRAAVEQQSVLGRRGRAGADDLAVEPDGVHEFTASRQRSRQAARAPPRSRPRRRLECLPLHGVRGRELLERLDPPRREPPADSGGSRREHERDRVRVPVPDEPALEQQRRRGPAARPSSRPPTASASARARAARPAPRRAPRRPRRARNRCRCTVFQVLPAPMQSV